MIKPFLALAVLLAGSAASAAPASVIMIRHGEKPDTGDELDERGWQRAHALVKYFETAPAVTRHGTPAAIYAMDPKDGGGSLRPIQTVTPLAQDLGLEVQHPYKKKQLPQLVKDVLGNPAYDGRTVLICWEHKVIPELVQDFGWNAAPKTWAGSVYDRAWILDFDRKGNPVGFTDAPENVLPGDSAD